MKQFAWLVIVLTLLVTPAFSQDEGEGGFNVDDLFNGEASPGQTPSAAKVDILVDLRSWLTKANAPPLDSKQEKPLIKVYDKEVKAMAKSFEKQFGIPLDSALAAQSPTRGRRGGGFARTSPEQAAEVRRLSDQLIDMVIAALRIDQQAALRRYQSEQLRVQRLNVLIQSMAAAGLPLTPEQKVQVEALYARESRLRTLIVVEAQGKPHGAKISQLEAQTTQLVVRLMNPTQKNALAQAVAKSKAR